MQQIVTAADGAVSAHLHIKGAAKAIEFYKEVFGATEDFRLTEPSGKVGHAEITIGKSIVMLSDEYPDFGALSPETVGGSPVTLHLYVSSADAIVDRVALNRLVAQGLAWQNTGRIGITERGMLLLDAILAEVAR